MSVRENDTETIEPEAPSPAAPRFQRSLGDAIAFNGERFGLVAISVLVCIVFTIAAPDTFPTTENLRSMLSSNSVLAMLAVATVIPFVVGQFDLSLGATLGMASMLAAVLMSRHGWALVPAGLAAVAMGALVGTVNGVVVARIGVNSIITTLGTASILAGLVLWISSGQTIVTGLSPKLLEFGINRWLGLPQVVFVAIALSIFVGYLLRQTPIGRSFQAIGNNERAANLLGMPVQRYTLLAFMLGGALAGLAGLAQTGVAGAANPNYGPNLLLPSLTAVFLGATAIRPGEYNVWGTLVAVAFVAVSISGLALVGAAAWVQPIYTGVALVVAVAFSTLIRRRRSGA